MSWIDNIINKSAIVCPNSDEERQLIKMMVGVAYSYEAQYPDLGLTLAAFYDLAIGSVYYSNITNSGWLYCKNDGKPKLLLPFVNCCPVHTLENKFVFHKSSKPSSAKIGGASSRILLLFYQELFSFQNRNIEVYNACEPADAIFIEKESNNVLFAEIKASPLLTLSLALDCELMTFADNDDGHISEFDHKATVNPNLIGRELYIMIPVKTANDSWEFKYYSIGCKRSAEDRAFAYEGISQLLQNDEFINDYIAYWTESFNLYCVKGSYQSIFWLTNACGKPNDLNEWNETTSISDSKTSVGMDRTDDIKKGIYQVLKLGSQGKLSDTTWNYKVGILSNIHPSRHFNTYILPIKDLVWTIAFEKEVNSVKDLSGDTPMYNLFDGIITFTKSYIRDKWLFEIFNSVNNGDIS